MIELIILLIIIVPRVRGLAKERNESAMKWSFAAIGAAMGACLHPAMVSTEIVRVTRITLRMRSPLSQLALRAVAMTF